MPEDPTPPPSQPRRHRPRLSELSRETTEEDLWDLESDLDEEKPEAGDTKPAKLAAEPRESRLETAELPLDAPEDPPEPAPAPRISTPARAPRPKTPESKATKPVGARRDHDDLGELDDETEEPAAIAPPEPEPAPAVAETEASAPEPAPAPAEPTPEPAPDPTPDPVPQKPKPEAAATASPLRLPDRKDLIRLGIAAAVFLGLAIWWLVSQFSGIATTRLGEREVDFPVKGTHARVTDAETYWREPVRAADGDRVASAEVTHIPVISVKLSEGSGALRAIYRDEGGEFVGDSLTRSFSGGRFTRNDSDTIEFPATDGFESNGAFNGYRVGTDRWTVEILEGPAADAPGSEFRSLFTAEISSNRR